MLHSIPSLSWSVSDGASVPGVAHLRDLIPDIIAGDLTALEPWVTTCLDPARHDLGDEGYEISVDGRITLVGRTETGIYRGALAAAQLLAFNDVIPAGRAVSVPRYRERGVTVSASTVIYSESWCRWLLDAMALMGLNMLLLEAKVESADPRLNTWPYWSKQQIETLVAMAKARHIEVIPEVNSPGHMATLLHYYPQYAVRRADGSVDTERLDLGSAEAIRFYLDLVDDYLEVFDSSWWHMGADEYEYHSITYGHFPSLAKAAVERFGEGATPGDLFIDVINQVAAHVRSKGKRLRIWNDGITEPNIVTLDSDVLIEYWLDRGLSAAELAERGYELMNAAQYLYWSRSVRNVYGVDCEQIYDMDFARFDDGSIIAHPTGAKLSIWPDMASAQTENEVLLEIRQSLALVAHACWVGEKPELSWPQFATLIDLICPAPVFETTEAGTYDIPALNDLDPGPWRIEPTYDGYATITAPSGARLASGEGRRVMGVVMEVGAPLMLAEPADMSATWLDGVDTAEQRNRQKWAITGADRLTITAALSGLVIGDLEGVAHVDLEARTGLGLVPPEMAGGLASRRHS